MAWKSERSDLASSSMTESSNYHVISTPCIPSSATDVGDSGYCTEIKPPKPSFAQQHVDFSPLKLDVSELCDHIHTESQVADRSTDRMNLESTDLKCHTGLSDVTSGYFTEFEHSQLSFAEKHADFFPVLNLDSSEEKTECIHSCLKACAVFAEASCSSNYVRVEGTDNEQCECRTQLSDVTSNYPDPDVVDWLASIVHTEPEGHLSTAPSHISASSCGDVINQLFGMPPVAAVILRHVSDNDLCRISCVCHAWKQAVCNDRVSHERRLHYLELQALNKENIEVKGCVARTMTSASRPLSSIQSTCSSSVDRSDVYTDASLQHCRRYWQIGSTLAPGERLSKCPRCESPVCTASDVARCTSDVCNYAACVHCRELYHAPAPCRQRPVRTPTSIGSRASKKRLKRL